MGSIRAAGLLVYRVASNNSFEYLLLQASYPPYHWTPPKDSGETLLQTALRETKEEASIDESMLDIHHDLQHMQSYATEKGPKTVQYWVARLKNSDVKLSHEHQDWKWAGLEEAVKLTGYPEMEKMLRDAEQQLKLTLS